MLPAVDSGGRSAEVTVRAPFSKARNHLCGVNPWDLVA